MFNAGVRGKRAKDGTGFISSTEQFVQQTYLIPTVTSFSVTDVSYVPLDNTAVNPAGGEIIVINGSGFAPGATVQVGATTIGSVTFIDQNRLAFSAPVLSSGSYTIYVTNSNGGTGILLSGLVYSGLPTYTTTAGTLGTIYETANINTAVVATGDAPITYSVISGTLPSGATLNSNGTITGNAPVDGSSTTYSFTIQASDAQLQDSTRAFTLTINTDVLTWGLANNTVYSLDGGTAMSNVTLSATSAANSNSAVTFAANTLPTGVSISGNTIFGTPTTEQTVYSTLTATATQTGRTATRFVTWVVSIADLFFDYTTLLIPGASTTFVDDASTNNFAVTINGDTRPNSFNPYSPGYYSNYFDGSSAISIPTAQTTTGSFTAECWFYRSADPVNYHVIFGGSNIGAGGTVNTQLTVRPTGAVGFVINAANGAAESASGVVPLGQWSHIVWVRSGTSCATFVNGSRVATGTSSGTLEIKMIGSGGNGSGGIFSSSYSTIGYISNARITTTAVYDPAQTTLTVPTSPLTAITGTTVLTCQSNRLIDNSSNAYVLTALGAPQIKSFDPFTPNSSYSSYGSGYFDGTGDYLSTLANTAFVFGTGDFTLEAWVYPTAAPSSPYGTIIGNGGDSNISANYNVQLYLTTGLVPALYVGTSATQSVGINSSSAILANTWNHIAATRSGNTFTLWVNGVSSATGTSSVNLSTSQDLYVGRTYSDLNNRYFVGYMTDARIVKGTAVYTTAFTPPSAPLTAIANTSLLTLQNNQPVNNSVFLDNSTNNFLVTRNGNTTQGTFSPYGGNWSNYFDGTGDYLTIANNAAFNFGTSAFTIECWFMLTADATADQDGGRGATLLCAFPNSGSFSSDWALGLDGNTTTTGTSISFASRQSGTQQYTLYTSTITKNVWHHVAATRTGNTLSLYYDGVRVSQNASFTNTVNSGGFPIKIGALLYSANLSGYMGYFPGFISNVRVVTGSVLYTGTTYTVPTTPLTPIANTVLLTCTDNRLVDDSINNFTITKNGDVSVQRFSPFNPSSVTPTSYSGYFDGTGDYLNTPSNAAFALGTGDFTMECWIYVTAAFGTTGSGRGAIISNRTAASGNTSYTLQHYNGKIYFGTVTTDVWPAGSNTTLSIKTWYHVAVTRSSGTVRLFLNGVSDATAVTGDTTNFSDTSATYIGCDGSYGGPLYQYTGYISNVRIVKGTAVYTSAFTPPTSPLTAIANTSLLTCQSPTFIDNSTNNFTITAFGNSKPTQQNPFGSTSALTEGYTVSTIGGSAYFDGTGDYLTIAGNSAFNFGTSNFTLECWVFQPNINAGTRMIAALTPYTTSNTGWGLYFGAGYIAWFVNGANRIVSSNPIAAGTWNHLAIVRSSSSTVMYINGVVAATAYSDSTNYSGTTQYIGSDATQNYSGYISDFRVVKGTAVYTSNFVPPSAPLTAVQNTVLLNNMTSAGVYDAAMMNNLETLGDAKLTHAVSKFGGSSMSFDGTGDYLSTVSTPNLAFGSGNFTIECWVYATSLGSYNAVFAQWPDDGGTTNNSYVLEAVSPNMVFYWVSGSTLYGPATLGTITTGVWTHYAICRSGNTLYPFKNGVLGTTVAISQTLNSPTSAVTVGGQVAGGGGWNGYIDDLRITKGYARYTSNFTAPLSAFKTK